MATGLLPCKFTSKIFERRLNQSDFPVLLRRRSNCWVEFWKRHGGITEGVTEVLDAVKLGSRNLADFLPNSHVSQTLATVGIDGGEDVGGMKQGGERRRQ